MIHEHPQLSTAARVNGTAHAAAAIAPVAALVDPAGHLLPPVKLTLMARIDKIASEKIELSRGTVWLLATVLVLAGVAFSYGTSVIAWVREDQATRERTLQSAHDIDEMKTQLNAMQTQIGDLQKTLNILAVKIAAEHPEVKGR